MWVEVNVIIHVCGGDWCGVLLGEEVGEGRRLAMRSR